MKNFVHVENGIVQNVSIGEDDWSAEGWVQSDVAQIGWTYADGIFTSPQPFPSWTLINNRWTAPIPKPNDGKYYSWNEELQSWTERIIA